MNTTTLVPKKIKSITNIPLSLSQLAPDDNCSTYPVNGTGKCGHSGCSCPSFVDPPGGFNCSRCGHPMSEHW